MLIGLASLCSRWRTPCSDRRSDALRLRRSSPAASRSSTLHSTLHFWLSPHEEPSRTLLIQTTPPSPADNWAGNVMPRLPKAELGGLLLRPRRERAVSCGSQPELPVLIGPASPCSLWRAPCPERRSVVPRLVHYPQHPALWQGKEACPGLPGRELPPSAPSGSLDRRCLARGVGTQRSARRQGT